VTWNLGLQDWLESLPAEAALGILFMSGYNESEVLRHGVQTRTMRLLRKPFTMEELLHAVRENLRRPSTPS
jgi:DNA-binding response OmpR family regulator